MIFMNNKFYDGFHLIFYLPDDITDKSFCSKISHKDRNSMSEWRYKMLKML